MITIKTDPTDVLLLHHADRIDVRSLSEHLRYTHESPNPQHIQTFGDSEYAMHQQRFYQRRELIGWTLINAEAIAVAGGDGRTE